MDLLEQTNVETINLTDAAVNTVKNLLVQKEVPNHGLRVFCLWWWLLWHAIWHGFRSRTAPLRPRC